MMARTVIRRQQQSRAGELMTSKTTSSFDDRIGRNLVEAGFITPDQLESARDTGEQTGVGLIETLVLDGLVSRDTLVTMLSFQLKIPVVDLKTVHVDPDAVAVVPEEFARTQSVLPIGFEPDGSLRTATTTPNDFQLASQIATLTGRQAKFVLALGGGLDELIARTYASLPAIRAEAQSTLDLEGENGAGAISIRPDARGILGQDVSQLPAIQAVEMVTLQAIKRGASDVHFVATSDSSRILFRLDGVLQEVAEIPIGLHDSMLARVKVLADMDITETRRPQDGSFNLRFNEKTVDFRVSSIGITWGEMMVVRILDRSEGILKMEQLGLEPDTMATWRQLLGLPFGMLLVSGPTGSGKTTTLYSSVTELIPNRGNILTIEDPIEYRVEDLHQIEVNRQAGIDFPTGLKAIMRLDPDVILVGEIRDVETAKTAVDAALTGQLVLASIHSNDAASAFVRLIDIGIEPYLAATAVVGVAAQRLVRKICTHCKFDKEIDPTERHAYLSETGEDLTTFVNGKGCNFCGFTGFLGRTGVFEILPVSEATRKLVASGASGHAIRQQAVSEGLSPLRRTGMTKVKAGVTTVNEVLSRVFFFE
jgi:type IV pilus assembly protein PilB